MTMLSKTPDKITDCVILMNSSNQQVNSTIDKVIAIYENLSAKSIDQLHELYTEDVYFEDPAHAIQGIKALKKYYEKLFNNVQLCQFGFHTSICEEDKLFLCWTMTLQHKHLNGGKRILVEGASLLKTRDDKVFYHRDYFDLGNMLYENIPLLGSLVRRAKKGLST